MEEPLQFRLSTVTPGRLSTASAVSVAVTMVARTCWLPDPPRSVCSVVEVSVVVAVKDPRRGGSRLPPPFNRRTPRG